MREIIYTIGSIIIFIFQAALIVGMLFILIYAIFNTLANARFFQKFPCFMRQFVFYSIDFTRVWGPNLLIFYIFGRLLLSILNFLGLSV